MYRKILSKKWATLVEIMWMLAIVWLGIAALLQTISSGIYFAKDTENNIKAINIAREGIEWVTNLRDTNWLRFSSDRINCWRVKDYDGGCINIPNSPNLIQSGSYTLYSKNGAWYLSGVTIAPASIDYATNWTAYRNAFRVWTDATGFWTQTGVVTSQTCSSQTQTGCLTIFNREIIIHVTSTGSMNVKSIVRWKDRRDRNVTLDTILTNWKSNF